MELDWGVMARAIHIASVVVWIGGVWLVTTVLLPAMRQRPAEEWIEEYDRIERRFGPQARLAALLTGASGLLMLYRYDLWSRFESRRFWWMDLMVVVWIFFAVILYGFEPLFFRHWVHRRGKAAPASTLRVMLWLHWVLLVSTMAAILAAVAGSHGQF